MRPVTGNSLRYKLINCRALRNKCSRVRKRRQKSRAPRWRGLPNLSALQPRRRRLDWRAPRKHALVLGLSLEDLVAVGDEHLVPTRPAELDVRKCRSLRRWDDGVALPDLI